jgi:hypothetical protein
MNNKSVISFLGGFITLGIYQTYMDNKMIEKIRIEQKELIYNIENRKK